MISLAQGERDEGNALGAESHNERLSQLILYKSALDIDGEGKGYGLELPLFIVREDYLGFTLDGEDDPVEVYPIQDEKTRKAAENFAAN